MIGPLLALFFDAFLTILDKAVDHCRCVIR